MECQYLLLIVPRAKIGGSSKCPRQVLRAASDGGGCWSPAKLSPLAADVTATSPSRQSVTGERPGGLEPAAASVLEPAGRRRLGTGTCD